MESAASTPGTNATRSLKVEARKVSQSLEFVFAKGGVRKKGRQELHADTDFLKAVAVGDKVVVTKVGTQTGKIATVVDPEWQGMVKVKLDGQTKSYHLHDLAKPSSEAIALTCMAGGKLEKPIHNRKQSKVSTMMGDLANFAQTAQKNRNLDFVRRGYNDAKAYRSRLAVKIALRELIIYAVFMVVFAFSTSRWVFSSDLYNLGAGLNQQLTRTAFGPVEFYHDIASVDTMNKWMLGPLSTFLFEHEDARPLGYNFFMGPVRVSQLRVHKSQCGEGSSGHVVVPAFMRSHSNRSFTCFDGGDVIRPLGHGENKEAFGNFTLGNGHNSSFLYDGINGHTGLPANMDLVSESRSSSNTMWTTFDNRLYPSPAFAVLLQPTKPEEGKRALQNLVESNYFDSQTRALFIDMTLFNPMVAHTCWMRFVLEVTEAGAIVPRDDFSVLHIWDKTDPSLSDRAYWVLEVVVILFYTYYGIQEVIELIDVRWEYFKSGLNTLQLINIVCFCCYQVMWNAADATLPLNFDVDGDRFVDFIAVSRLKCSAKLFGCCIVFLNWAKLIAYLNLNSSCYIMTATLTTALHHLMGFLFVFAIILYGFAQAHNMAFGARLYQFKTIGQSSFTLFQSLLGDFDFEMLQRTHSVMGPLFFIMFVGLAVLVVLNVAIAIIVDSFGEVKKRLETQNRSTANKMGKMISDISREYIHSWPWCGPWLAKKMFKKRTTTETITGLSGAIAGISATRKKLAAARTRIAERNKNAEGEAGEAGEEGPQMLGPPLLEPLSPNQPKLALVPLTTQQGRSKKILPALDGTLKNGPEKETTSDGSSRRRSSISAGVRKASISVQQKFQKAATKAVIVAGVVGVRNIARRSSITSGASAMRALDSMHNDLMPKPSVGINGLVATAPTADMMSPDMGKALMAEIGELKAMIRIMCMAQVQSQKREDEEDKGGGKEAAHKVEANPKAGEPEPREPGRPQPDHAAAYVRRLSQIAAKSDKAL